MIMKEIIPIVMNSQFEKIALIDDYISLIWTTRYYDCGDFEICVPVSEKYANTFYKDYFIMRDDDENVGVIEKIMIQDNEDDQQIMIISGRFLASILARRIIAQQTVVSGLARQCIAELITYEAIATAIVARIIQNMQLYASEWSTPIADKAGNMKAQYTGDNLLETIFEICKTYGIGFKITFDDVHNYFLPTVYEGIDRSYGQTANTYVVFSDQFDNLLSSQYMEDYREIITDVLVAGEGEGTARKTLWVNAEKNIVPDTSAYWEKSGGTNTPQIRTITGVTVQPDTFYSIETTGSIDYRLSYYTQEYTGDSSQFISMTDWISNTSDEILTPPNCKFIKIAIRKNNPLYGSIAPSDIGTNITFEMVEEDTGLNRYEVYKDRRDLQSNDGEISDEEYEELLYEAGLQSMNTVITAFTGTVYFGNIKWKQDVNIGDICVIENKKWGVYINSRLIEVIESISESGEYSIVPTFGV